MLPIKVKLTNVVDRYDLSQSQAEELANLVTSHLANTLANNMISLAKLKLHKTRKMFTDAIRVFETSKYEAGVEIIGVMPNAVTFGMDAFDMKIGFSRSVKKKQKKDGGWYLTIPMRYANPNAVASSTIFSSVMPTAVYNIAKTLTSGGKGISKSQLPAGFDMAKLRPASESAAGIIPEYQHDSPMFAGLQKTGSGNQSQYGTFRRISDKSDANSWLHKGFAAKNIHLEALHMLNIKVESQMIIDTYLKNKLGL